MNANDPKEFKEFTSQFSSDYLQNNYKEIVKEFSIKENTEKKRKVRPPMILNNKPLISFYSLEQYQEMTVECLSKPLANKEVVIQTLLQKYINNPLKNVKSDDSTFYQNIKAGQINVYNGGNSFLFYSRIIKIEELIKFEYYLLNDLKNETSKQIDLTDDQTALKMYYEEMTNVTREKHGNSLYNKFIKWSKRINRLSNDGTNLQLQNKIDKFERVIEVLDEKFKQKAIDEVTILKTYLPKN